MSETGNQDAKAQQPFSVLMAVYEGDSAPHVLQAIQSATIEQTLPPAQIVIVRDGVVNADIQRMLDTLEDTIDIWFITAPSGTITPKVTIVELDENDGLAHALNIGLQYCDFDIVARADSDDISLPKRFETIIPLLTASNSASDSDIAADASSEAENTDNAGTENAADTNASTQENGDVSAIEAALPNDEALEQQHQQEQAAQTLAVDVVGSAIREFSTDGKRRIYGQTRVLPAGGEELASYARLQSPVHHPSVAFRKSAVESVGGYPEDAGRFEDYLLWARMMMHGSEFANVAEPLVLYRIDEGAYDRRGGKDMFRAEMALQWQFRRDGFTSVWQFLRNVSVRTAYRLVPTKWRKAAYRKLVAKRNAQVGETEEMTDVIEDEQHTYNSLSKPEDIHNIMQPMHNESAEREL